jgi:hypothetical protein
VVAAKTCCLGIDGNNRDDIATIPTRSRALDMCILDRIEPFA